MPPTRRPGRHAALCLAALLPSTSWAATGPVPFWAAHALFGVGAIVVVWLLLREALSADVEKPSGRDEAGPRLPRAGYDRGTVRGKAAVKQHPD